MAGGYVNRIRTLSSLSWVIGLEKRKLGRTGLEVSVIGFGGGSLGYLTVEEAEKLVRGGFELGVNYFDTSRVYWDSEEKIGRALEDVRDDCILATKVRKRTREYAARANLKQSLRNLRTDRIDLVQLHSVNDLETLKMVMSEDGALSAVKRAKSKGQVDHIGITGHIPYVLSRALETGEFDTVLVPLSIINREAEEELIPLAKELDIGVVVMKAFGAREFYWVQRGARAENRAIQFPPKDFETIFGKPGPERAHRSLRYILAQDISTIIPGFFSIEEVKAAVKVAEGFDGLTDEEKKEYRFGEMPPEPFCRDCGICLPCPDDIDIPTVLRFDRYLTYYGLKDWARRFYQKLPTKVNSCSKCGECETKCPYNLPVIKMLEKANRRLGFP